MNAPGREHARQRARPDDLNAQTLSGHQTPPDHEALRSEVKHWPSGGPFFPRLGFKLLANASKNQLGINVSPGRQAWGGGLTCARVEVGSGSG